MDYEKAYKEALERAKKYLGDCMLTRQEYVEKVFPELKESEDEKIRKHLITLFKDEYGEHSNARFAGIKVKDIIVWLEKQGGQKSDAVQPKFKIGDIVKHKDNPHLTYILKRFTDDGDYEFHAIGKDGNEGGTCFVVVKHQDDWELVEQNPDWSEEDERMYRGLHNLIYSTPYCDSRKNLSDWLKSLKDRVQIKVEWNEEDKKCIRLSTDIIDCALRAGFCVQLDRDRCVDWLKSLRPQSH